MNVNARFVALSTLEPLVPQDTNGVWDLYVYERGVGFSLLPADVTQAGYPSGYPINFALGWRPVVIGISDDGRYVSYVLERYDGTTTIYGMVLARYDRQTNTRIVVLADEVRYSETPLVMSPAVSEDGQTFVWARGARASPGATVFAQTIGGPAEEVGRACFGLPECAPSALAVTRAQLHSSAAVTEGPRVYFTAEPNAATGAGVALAVIDLGFQRRDYYPQVTTAVVRATFGPAVAVGNGVLDRSTGRLDPVTPPLGTAMYPKALAPQARQVLVTPFQSASAGAHVFDRNDGTLIPLHANDVPVGITDSGRDIVTTRTTGAGTFLVFWTLDADADLMLDTWELRYGLDPTNPADALADADGDGIGNVQEYFNGSAPTPLPFRRLFAEGAAGSFFDTQVHIFNPGVTTANVVVGFLTPTGGRTNQAVTLPPNARTTLASCCLASMTADEFAIVVESDQPVVAERGMTWDRVTGYGSHATTGAAAPSTEWYFAEGATIADFQLFYLLSNPGNSAATVDVEYLLASGTSVSRQYTVGANSRLTVWVNQEGTPLDAAEVSARIIASQPIVAERASYRTRGTQTWAAGSASMGVTAPATTWRFAEGATGAFFDTFLLVGNAGTAPVKVEATYQLPSGVTLVKTYGVPAKSRLTIWVDQEDAALAETAVSTVLTASGPIVAERAMWWPGDASTWGESHTEAGATATATKWAVADAVAGTAASTSTFLLLSNPGAIAGRARVTLYNTTGTVAGIAEYALPPTSRTTAWLVQDFPMISNGLFSAIVESLPVQTEPAVAISVERASYSLDFAAGSATAATPVP